MIWFYTSLSVLVVSLVSLVGILTFSLKEKVLEKILIYLVSLSVGTLLGGAFFHLIPEAFSEDGLSASFLILLGILVFFILEKIVHWRHCHEVACDEHPHPFSYMIFAGDTLHNFIDGAIIAASFMVSIPLGLATTIAVILHEIPQEIGDFGSLVYAGFSRSKALAFNFISALSAFAGAFIVLIIGERFLQMTEYLIPITAGGFIYIAMADLMPEIHKTKS
ncbi:MAG: ZIP family metal transporter, partial [Candidatus Moranbacteria bacterium]|nr:ZIP family metal transporter [Candidatus Moranbacteria bacterium]